MDSDQKKFHIWSQILAQAWANKDFKNNLVAHPNQVLKENGFLISPNVSYTILEDTEDLHYIVIAEKSPHLQYQHSERAKTWEKLMHEMHSNPEKTKKELLADPLGTMKKYGIPASKDTSYKVVFETAKEKYLVLPKNSNAPLSEKEMKQIQAGISLSAGFCTDCSG